VMIAMLKFQISEVSSHTVVLFLVFRAAVHEIGRQWRSLFRDMPFVSLSKKKLAIFFAILDSKCNFLTLQLRPKMAHSGPGFILDHYCKMKWRREIIDPPTSKIKHKKICKGILDVNFCYGVGSK
jgi:hypothetical protein